LDRDGGEMTGAQISDLLLQQIRSIALSTVCSSNAPDLAMFLMTGSGQWVAVVSWEFRRLQGRTTLSELQPRLKGFINITSTRLRSNSQREDHLSALYSLDPTPATNRDSLWRLSLPYSGLLP
jgi:hypothetical protein